QDEPEHRPETEALDLLDRRRRELAPARRSRPTVLLETNLPQIALDHARHLQLAARRERDLARRDRRLVVAVRRPAPYAAYGVRAPDRPRPRVADRVARLEEVLRRRRRAVLEAVLRPLLAPAGHRLGLAEPQVVLHVRLAVPRVQPGQHEVPPADLP